MYIQEGTQVHYIHCAITPWLAYAAIIRDAARQALVVNRDRHFDDITWEDDRYLPRRRSRQSTCNIAGPLGEANLRLRPTLLCLAKTNTDLDQTLDELDFMRKAYLELARENAKLKQQQGGLDEEALGVPAQSPPRNRGEFGDPNTSTNVDPSP